MTTMTMEAAGPQASDREQKMAALNYVQGAWMEARQDGVDDDCMAQSCLFVALLELVSTYGEEATAHYAANLPARIRNGEFTLRQPAQ